MKWCPNCNVAYEDGYSQCPACKARLEPMRGASSEWRETPPNYYPNDSGSQYVHRPSGSENYPFVEKSGRSIIVNGEVADLSTQQLYQSRFTKIVRALFSGEPYQLSHTSFITIFRVEEHVDRGYPEKALDFTIFGSLRNLLSPGDDVSVTAKQKGHRYIARHIYNHSTDSPMRITPNISATVIRILFLLFLIAIAATVILIASIDYSAIGNAIEAAILSILPAAIMIGAIVYYIVHSIRRK